MNKMMAKIKKCFFNYKIIYYIVALIFILTLGLFLYLTLNAKPSADDYSNASRIKEIGRLAYNKERRETWNGRYSDALICSIQYTYTSYEDNYGISLLISALLFFATVFYFVNWLFDTSKKLVLFLGILILTTYFSIVPNISHTFFWFPSCASGMIPASLLVLHFINLVDCERKYSIVRIFIAVLFTIYLIGSSEIFMGLVLVMNSFFVYKLTVKMGKLRPEILFLLLVTIASTVFVLTAPGNQNRLSYFENRQDLVGSLHASIFWTFSFFRKYVFVKFSVILGLIGVYLLVSNGVLKLKVKFSPFIVLIALLSVLVSASFIPFYSMGPYSMPDRTENYIVFLFLLGLIILVSSLAETGGINLSSRFKNIQELILIIFIVFIFSLDLSLLGGLYNDVFVILPKYKEEYEERLDKINSYKNTRGSDKPPFLELEEYHNIPVVYKYNTDIQGDTKHWINQAYSKYYNISAVKRVKYTK